MIIQPHQFITQSLRDSPWGTPICNILAAAIKGADAGAAIYNHISCDLNQLYIDNLIYDLNQYNRIFIIGAGKACVPMVVSINEILGNRITSGFVITKVGYTNSTYNSNEKKIRIVEADHPIPDQRNLIAAQQIISMANDMNSGDLVILLLSGGGSSLLTSPSSGISLHDIQVTTGLLLGSGATIAEINTIRKHIDQFKGGGLAKLLSPATVITLILSDVVGDHLDTIASGPTVVDTTTFSDAWKVLEKYQLIGQIPETIRSHISMGMAGLIPDTTKPGDPILERVKNIIIGRNQDAVMSALDASILMGFTSSILTTSFQGEASQIGQFIAEKSKSLIERSTNTTKPACFIAGGETTVTINGTGKGGRNQELALGAVKPLSGADPMILVSLATDGGDGPTDAAGAVITNRTYSNGLRLGLDPFSFLNKNDSYHYFEALGDLIKTGPTLTNVNDLVFVFCF
jgi:glycerate 2-kinase